MRPYIGYTPDDECPKCQGQITADREGARCIEPTDLGGDELDEGCGWELVYTKEWER